MNRLYLKTAAALILSTLFTAAIWYLYYKTYFTGLILNDAMDYAGIARNVARGQGFISQYITPLGLAHHGIPQPDLWRAPLWPLILAGFQKVLGFTDEASALGSGFFFILTGPVIFLLARQWFGYMTAIGAVFVYSLTPSLLSFSISGMTEPIAMFLMALAVLTVSNQRLKNTLGDWLAGGVLGLFYLARYNGLLFLPFFLIYRWHYRKKGLPPAGRMLLGFLAVILPWLIRNTVLFQNPLFSLQKYEPVMFTRLYPDYSLYLFTSKVEVGQFVTNHLDLLIVKISENWLLYREIALTDQINFVTGFFFILFVISLLIPFGKKVSGIKPLLIMCYLSQLGALLVIHLIPRLFVIFTPFYIIFAIGGLLKIGYYLAEKLNFRTVPHLLAVIFILFLSFQNIVGQKPPEMVPPDRERYSRIIRELASMVPNDQLILTNEGHLVSWYGDRFACKIPYSVQMIPEIQSRARVGAFFLSDRILWHMPEADPSWKRLYFQQPRELYGMKLVESMPFRGAIYK
ncbi:MAG: hypothetical protein HGA27_02880 [Peptococcaceae bacterium]|nr:hypothetical protein [Peptococcaceae bacterium]